MWSCKVSREQFVNLNLFLNTAHIVNLSIPSSHRAHRAKIAGKAEAHREDAPEEAEVYREKTSDESGAEGDGAAHG
jgi:hypothetical protein